MRQIYQFKITLQDIKPTIWRRIQISDLCTFWSLHVAIQDAMGWKDYHLHEFTIMDSEYPEDKIEMKIGIPFEDDFEEYMPHAGWNIKVSKYLAHNKSFQYLYDFGDNWRHLVEFEGVLNKSPKARYPICIGGEMACPPEDVGGIYGYKEFLKAIKNKKHPEHQSYLDWIEGAFDPNKFDVKKVKFHSPNTRLDTMLYDDSIE
jgi:hypothetical protein